MRHTLTPHQAFDALYEYCAPALVRQAYLLTGRRDLARAAVERAFQLAWQRWPEVAVDRDPMGWVRAAVHDRALSPWHRLRLHHRRSEPPPPGPTNRALLHALLELPPTQRRALLLHDGLGLDLPDVAAETEASTPATAGRLLRAHTTLAALVPDQAEPDVLPRRLAELASSRPLRAPQAPSVRSHGERRTRQCTRAAIALTMSVIGATTLTLRTAANHYEPPVGRGTPIHDIPPRPVQGPLSRPQTALRTKLMSAPHQGTARLTPQPR